MFDIIEAPVKNAVTDQIIKGRKGLFVDDHCVNIVSDRYKVVQPQMIVDLFQSNTNLEITKTASNVNNGSLLLGAKYKDITINNEAHNLTLSFYTGHNTQYSTFVSLQALRVACMNQLPALIGSPQLHLMKCKHIHEFPFDDLQKLIETLPRHVSNFEVQCDRLKESKLTLNEFLELYVEFFKLQEKASKDKTISKITALYKQAPGQDIITNDTAYKAFHTVTYDLTHNIRNSKNNLEKVNVQNQKQVYKFFDFLEKQQVLAA